MGISGVFDLASLGSLDYAGSSRLSSREKKIASQSKLLENMDKSEQDLEWLSKFSTKKYLRSRTIPVHAILNDKSLIKIAKENSKHIEKLPKKSSFSSNTNMPQAKEPHAYNKDDDIDRSDDDISVKMYDIHDTPESSLINIAVVEDPVRPYTQNMDLPFTPIKESNNEYSSKSLKKIGDSSKFKAIITSPPLNYDQSESYDLDKLTSLLHKYEKFFGSDKKSFFNQFNAQKLSEILNLSNEKYSKQIEICNKLADEYHKQTGLCQKLSQFTQDCSMIISIITNSKNSKTDYTDPFTNQKKHIKHVKKMDTLLSIDHSLIINPSIPSFQFDSSIINPIRQSTTMNRNQSPQTPNNTIHLRNSSDNYKNFPETNHPKKINCIE